MTRRFSPALMALLIALCLMNLLGCAGSSQSEEGWPIETGVAATPSVDQEVLKTWLADAGLPEDMPFDEAKSAILAVTVLRQEDLFQEIEDRGLTFMLIILTAFRLGQ